MYLWIPKIGLGISWQKILLGKAFLNFPYRKNKIHWIFPFSRFNYDIFRNAEKLKEFYSEQPFNNRLNNHPCILPSTFYYTCFNLHLSICTHPSTCPSVNLHYFDVFWSRLFLPHTHTNLIMWGDGLHYSFHNIYVYQIIILYTLGLYVIMYQLYLNKSRKK